MSLVHDALDRLPERQTVDNGLANPLARKASKKTPIKISWPAVVVAVLVIVIGTQAFSLYRSRTASPALNNNKATADTANTAIALAPAITPAITPAIATTVITASDASATAAPVIAVVAATAAPLPVSTAVAQAKPSVVTSQVVSTLVAAPISQVVSTLVAAPISNVAPVTAAPSAAKVVITAPTAAKTAPATQPVAVAQVATIAPIPTTTAAEVAIATPTSSTPTPSTPASATTTTGADIPPAVISTTTVLPTPKANASVSAKNTAEALQKIIRAAADAVNSGNYPAAELLLEDALAADPDNLAMTLALARFWIKSADYGAALTVLQHSQDDAALALRGLVYELQDDVSQAMQLYQLLAKSQSLPSSYQLRYAVLLENDGNVIAAQQWYQTYLKQPDQDSAARLFAAQRLQQLSEVR